MSETDYKHLKHLKRTSEKKWKGLEIIKNDQKWQIVIMGEKWQKMTENDTERMKDMFKNWYDTLISTAQPLKCSEMTKHDVESFWQNDRKWHKMTLKMIEKDMNKRNWL